MTKMKPGTWVAIVGVIIAVLVSFGSFFTSTGSVAPFIIGGMLILFGVLFVVFYKLFFGPMINARWLLKNGIPGKAVIREVRDTGITINNNPQVKLLLEVKNNFGQKYEATVRTLVSRINPFAFRPGMEVAVKIDPGNEQNVAIDMTQVSAGNFAQAATDVLGGDSLKSELEQLQQLSDAISLTGRRARAIIKKYTWLGVYVNGQNPFAEIEMEVLPEYSSSFSARTRAVIDEASVPAHQPGSEIYVKYDYYDNARVIIDHSGPAASH